jgi:hypothetical protein
MKTTLHRLALRMGWYKDITTGLPLNVCRTVFGAYFMEGCYTPEPLSKLLEDVYRWGASDGRREAAYRPKKGDWKTTKDGNKRYRRVSCLREGWATETESLMPKEMVILPPPQPWTNEVW